MWFFQGMKRQSALPPLSVSMTAAKLGDRVLVMSGRPGRIRDDIRIPLTRPRDLVRHGDARVSEIEARIWSQLEDEVRKSLRGAR